VKGRRYARLPDLGGTKDSNLGRRRRRKKKKSRPPLCKWPYGKALPLVGGCLRVPLIFRRMHFLSARKFNPQLALSAVCKGKFLLFVHGLLDPRRFGQRR
jgi:hypothetical protein